MKLVLSIVGVLLAAVGSIFFLQGIGVLQGSSMSDQSQWALIGILAIIIGVGLLILNRRQPRD